MFASAFPLIAAVTPDGSIALHPGALIAWVAVGLLGLVGGGIAVRVSARHLAALKLSTKPVQASQLEHQKAALAEFASAA